MARDVTVPGKWAETGTNTPAVPVVGEIYRKETAPADLLAQGWKFSNVVPSDVFNQFMFMLSSVVKLMEQQGVLQWSPDVDYNKGAALVIGSNNKLYVSVQASGPNVAGAGAQDPSTDILQAYWLYTQIGQGSAPQPPKAVDQSTFLYWGNVWAS